MTNHGFGLLYEMGCGKTLTAIAITGAAFLKGKVKKLLVVAPASVVPVWSKEFDNFADFPYMVGTMQGTANKKIEIIKRLQLSEQHMSKPMLYVAVINYESVWREQIFDTIKKWNPDMIICDESQRIKSNSAQQSKAMHDLGDIARYKLILSGTPIQNSAMDVWSQYRFLDKTVFGDNFYSFRARYGVLGGFNGKQVVGVRDVDLLTEKAHSIAYRVTKDEALDLPEQTFENREIELTAKERKLYNEIKKECFAEIDGGTISAAMITTKLLRLQQITGGFIQLDDDAKPKQIGTGKLKALEDIVDDYVVDGGKKLVIFARFIPEIHAICEMLDKKKIPDGKGGTKPMRYSKIWGAVKLEDRGEQVRQFQQEDDVRVFVAQIDTAGLGITLTAADTAVYYSLNYNYAAYEQSLARIHRIGQKNNCTYIHLVCPKTVDTQILKALHKKEDLAKSIVDNWKMYFE